jgi:hypothetical protein
MLRWRYDLVLIYDLYNDGVSNLLKMWWIVGWLVSCKGYGGSRRGLVSGTVHANAWMVGGNDGGPQSGQSLSGRDSNIGPELERRYNLGHLFGPMRTEMSRNNMSFSDFVHQRQIIKKAVKPHRGNFWQATVGCSGRQLRESAYNFLRILWSSSRTAQSV